MGRHMPRMEITATLSRHNSERDRRDDQLWEELEARIRQLISEPRYRDIMPDLVNHG